MDGLWSILPLVIEIAVPALLVLIGWGVRAFVKKLGAEEQINVDHLIEQIVERAVDCIEQLSETAKKHGKEAIASEDKLASAIQLINQELECLNLPKIVGSLLKMKVEAYLRSLERAKEN